MNNGLPCDIRPLAPAYGGLIVEAAFERRRLLKTSGDFLQHLSVGAADEDSDLLQAGKLICNPVESADKEVADGDVGAFRAAEHLLEPDKEGGVGCAVEDAHGISLRPAAAGSSREYGERLTDRP